MLRKKRTIIAAVALVFVILGSVLAEAVISGRFKNTVPEVIEVQAKPESQAEKVVIIEKEIIITPSPAPATPEPTPEPPVQQQEEVYVPPAENTEPQQQYVPPTEPEPQAPAEPAPAYERPQVIEQQPPAPEPAPEPVPEVHSITLNAGSVSILTGDKWQLSVLSAPSSLTSQGGRWVTSNAAVADLSGQRTESVVIEGKSPGSATITIYSKDGQYSASCSVTVS